VDSSSDHFLHHLPVLAGLDDGLTRESQYAAGSVILREGEPGNGIYFIRSGLVRIVKYYGAEPPVVLAEMGPGDFFGEMSLVESVARSASVVASADTAVFLLRGLDFLQLYQKRPEQYGIVMLNLARELARRLRTLDEKFALRST